MTYTITAIEAADNTAENIKALASLNIVGTVLESDEDIHKLVLSTESKSGIEIESIEFNHEQSEEEAEEEHEAMIDAAMRESEESGIPFDHIMGEILGGMRDAEYCY